MQSVQNYLSYLVLYGVQYKSQLICVSFISLIKVSIFVVLQNILVTPYDCESYQQNQKCYTRNQGKLHWRAKYLVHPCHLYRVFFEAVISDRVATPAAFRLARMQNHNKAISAPQGTGVNKMIESNYSLIHSIHSCVAALFPAQQLLLDSQTLTDPTVPYVTTGKDRYFSISPCLLLAMGLYSVASRDLSESLSMFKSLRFLACFVSSVPHLPA